MSGTEGSQPNVKGGTQNEDPNQSVWIFGYGSLIWKTNFVYEHKVVGHVRGYARRFWQGSPDHRGVPGDPGRVVTLIESKEENTWGIAYRVNSEDLPEVMDYLNQREVCGYKMHEVLFYPGTDQQSTTALKTLIYTATETNPSYLGPATVKDIAKQIVNSHGPSGCNIEYLLELAIGMRIIAPDIHDGHLFGLETKVKELLRERKQNAERSGLKSVCKCSYCC